MLSRRYVVATTARNWGLAAIVAASRSMVWDSGAGSGSYTHNQQQQHTAQPHQGDYAYQRREPLPPPRYGQHHHQYPSVQYAGQPPQQSYGAYPAPHIDVRQMPGAPPPSGSSFSWRDFARRVIVGGLGWGALFTALALGLSPVSAMANVKQRGDWPFILAKGAMWDPMFRDSLVLIFDCGALSGAQGIVINKPAMGPLPTAAAAEAGEAAAAGGGGGGESDAAVSSAPAGPGSGPTLRGENLPTGQSWLVSQELARNPVFVGGPLALDAAEPLIVHGVPDVAGSHEALPGLFVGGDHRVLRRKVLAGACAPDEMLLVIGFSSWRLGQLQREIRKGTWQSGAIAAASSTASAVAQDSVEAAESVGEVAGGATASVRVRQLLRAMNAAASDSDSSAGGRNDCTAQRIHRSALERGLAAMVTDRFMDVARVIPVPPATAAALSEEDKAKVDAIEPMPSPPAPDADDATHADFSQKRAAWLKQNFDLSNIPADSVHAHVKNTLTTTHSPLFGYAQRTAASKVNGDTMECLAGYATKCPAEHMRSLQLDDYVPVLSAESLRVSSRFAASGSDEGKR